MTKLSPDQIAAALTQLQGWELTGEQIVKTCSFKNYYQTIGFVNAVAWIAHQQDHHPDLEVGYNKCKVRYSTHSAGGVTEKDVQCARLVDRLCATALP